jgi:hypothetical protein
MTSASPVERRFYRLGGVDLRVRADHPLVARGLDNVFSYFGLTAATTARGDRPVALDFLTSEPAFPIPSDASREARFGGVTVWEAGRELYLAAGASVARLDPRSGIGVAAIDPAPWVRPENLEDDPVTLVVLALTILLRHRDLYGLHAGALSWEGTGCLLIAEGSSGKSTTSLHLVRQGWDYVSDDFVFLRPSGDRVEVVALRRNLCMGREATRDFPDLLGRWKDRPFSGASKRWLEMRALYPRQVKDSCVPRVLLFPEIVAAPHSRIEPLSDKAEILGRLMQQSKLLVLEPEMSPRHLEALKVLLLQSSCYRLFAGRDLKEHPERAASLLSVCRHGAP